MIMKRTIETMEISNNDGSNKKIFNRYSKNGKIHWGEGIGTPILEFQDILEKEYTKQFILDPINKETI